MNRVANQGARQAAVNNWPPQCARTETSCAQLQQRHCLRRRRRTSSPTARRRGFRTSFAAQARNNPTVTICYPGKTHGQCHDRRPGEGQAHRAVHVLLHATTRDHADSHSARCDSSSCRIVYRTRLQVEEHVHEAMAPYERVDASTDRSSCSSRSCVPSSSTIGSIVVSVGNWYVLKRHLQTQVDAAALAGGPAFTGCGQDPARRTSRSRSRRSSTRATLRATRRRTTCSSSKPAISASS